jgi:hypothetical protein
MGDAQRRKKLGILPKPKVVNAFKVELKGEIEQSYIAARIFDEYTEFAVTMQFHLYCQQRKLYAEVAFDRADWPKYGWVGEHIAEISPLICALVVQMPSFEVGQIDKEKLG